MKKFIAILSIMFLLPVIAPVNAKAQSEKIVVAVDEASPPYMYGPLKVAKGLYPIIIKAIFDKAGIETEVLGFPWKRAMMKGTKGETAIGGIFKNDARLKIFDYTDPFFDEKLYIYVKKGNVFNFKELADLNEKLVGVNRGWSYGEEFDALVRTGVIKTQEADDSFANFKNLIRDRIDCIIVSDLSATQIINQEHIEDKVEKLPNSALIIKIHLAFIKKINKLDIITKFNTALAAMQKDGSHNAIIDKFINSLQSE